MDQARWNAIVAKGWANMMALPTEPATDAGLAIDIADRPIFDAAAALERFAAQTASLRSGLRKLTLPIDAAADRLDHADDMLAIVAAQIERALSIIGQEIDRRQEANPDHYFAPMAPLANDNGADPLEDVA